MDVVRELCGLHAMSSAHELGRGAVVGALSLFECVPVLLRLLHDVSA